MSAVVTVASVRSLRATSHGHRWSTSPHEPYQNTL